MAVAAASAKLLEGQIVNNIGPPFHSTIMKTFFAVLLLLSACSALAAAVDLSPETADAFRAYTTDFEARRLKESQFLRSEQTAQHRDQLRRGEVVVFPGAANGETEVKSGLIHDWIGAVFVPSTTMEKVLRVIQDYSHQKDTYAPEIADSQIRSHRDEDDYNVFMRIVKSKFMMTDVLNTEHEIHFARVSPDRVYCRSYSTRIAEVSDPGTPREHELPVGKDRGMLWRMYGYWFFDQRDGGVYIEYESITLSRDVPMLMSKVLGPILHGLPAESLRTSMEKTRKAVAASAGRTAD